MGQQITFGMLLSHAGVSFDFANIREDFASVLSSAELPTDVEPILGAMQAELDALRDNKPSEMELTWSNDWRADRLAAAHNVEDQMQRLERIARSYGINYTNNY